MENEDSPSRPSAASPKPVSSAVANLQTLMDTLNPDILALSSSSKDSIPNDSTTKVIRESNNSFSSSSTSLNNSNNNPNAGSLPSSSSKVNLSSANHTNKEISAISAIPHSLRLQMTNDDNGSTITLTDNTNPQLSSNDNSNTGSVRHSSTQPLSSSVTNSNYQAINSTNSPSSPTSSITHSSHPIPQYHRPSLSQNKTLNQQQFSPLSPPPTSPVPILPLPSNSQSTEPSVNLKTDVDPDATFQNFHRKLSIDQNSTLVINSNASRPQTSISETISEHVISTSNPSSRSGTALELVTSAISSNIPKNQGFTPSSIVAEDDESGLPNNKNVCSSETSLNQQQEQVDTTNNTLQTSSNNTNGTGTTSTGTHHNSMIGVRHSYLSSGTGYTEPAPTIHWSKLQANGTNIPPSLRAQSSILLGHDKLLFFGGCNEGSCFSDIWIYDIESLWWFKPKCSGDIPPPCRAHSASLLYDRWMIVFGGGDGPSYYNTVYILDVETFTWYKPGIKGSPPGQRRAHAAWIYNNDLYIYAGGDGSKALDDLYILNTSKVSMEMVCKASISSGSINSSALTWAELKPTGSIPAPRGYHTATLISGSDYLILIGGSDGHECFSDVHILDLKTLEWKLISMERAFPRLSHTAVQVGSYIFVIGGHDGTQYSMDMILLNLVSLSWETRSVNTKHSMQPRGYHTANLADSRIWVYGGYDGGKVYGDMWILELGSCSYLPQITSFDIAINHA